MSKAWEITKNVFWVMVIVASLFILFNSLNLFGYQMYVVKSGSMEPAIHTGSVVVDHKSNDYSLDNIVTYKLKDDEDTVTHRVVDVQTDDDVTVYTTKGDANDTADPDPVLETNIVGKVLFSIPLLGYLIDFIRTLPGLIIFIIIPAAIIIYDEINKIKPEAKKISDKRKKAKRSKKETDEINDLDTPPDVLDTKKSKKKSPTKKELIQ